MHLLQSKRLKGSPMTASNRALAHACIIFFFCMLTACTATPGFLQIVDNVYWFASNATCTLLTWLGYYFASDTERRWKKWFVLGTSLYFIGGIFWVWEVITHQTDLPAKTDLFFPLLGPCLIIGFIVALHAQLSRAKTLAFVVDATAFSVAVLGYVLISYLPHAEKISLTQLAVLTAYPVSFLSAAMISLLLIPYLRPALMLPWCVLSAGLLLDGVCWMQWNLNQLNHMPQTNTLLNIAFSVADVLIGFGLFGWNLRASKDRNFHWQCQRLRSAIPLIAFTFSLFTLLIIWLQSGQHPYSYHIATCAVMAILICSALRQSILLRETEKLLSSEKLLAEKEQAYRQLSQFDPLTQLPNRLSIQNTLEHALILASSESNNVVLMMIDMKQFQSINDSFGHAAGDLFLVEMAKRLQHITKDYGQLGRMHSDKFALITSNKTDAELSTFVEQVFTSLHRPVLMDEHELILDACIGMSVFPRDANNAIELMRHANTALSHAKQSAHQPWLFYCKEQTKGAQRAYRLDIKLRKAIKKQAFLLQFQPIFCMDHSGQLQIKQIEALVRLKNHKDEIISPADFIPYAEKSGLIIPIGEWVISQSCKSLAQLKQYTGLSVELSINISPRQFRDPNLLPLIASKLDAYGIPPQCITLEITESAMFEHEQQAIATLHEMKAMGLKIALDDFGVGNSSLFKLKHLPIDELKIDRAFLVDVPESHPDKEILSTIIKTAKILDIFVVVEGVETEAQFEFLNQIHCDSMQGFLLGKPMSMEAMTQLLISYQDNLPNIT